MGDEEAFGELYVRFWPRLKCFCLRFLHSGDMAENYSQDVFVKIWESREMLDWERSFSGYLYVIARNMVFNYLKREAMSDRKTEKFIKNYMENVRRNATDDGVIEGDYMKLLQKGILSLPARQQQVFRMSREGRMSHREIAEHLGLSVYTVQEYISDAIARIKEYIGRNSDISFIITILTALMIDGI